MEWVWLFVAIVIAVIVVASAAIKIVSQWEAGVVMRLGKWDRRVRQPGIRFIIPFVDNMRKVDTRIVTMEVPSQEAITRDNVTVKVSAVVYFRVIHPELAVFQVLDHIRATAQIAQTTLRSVIGQSELDELLAQREKLNQALQRIIDEQTEPWGVKVSVVELKDVELPQAMQRAIGRQAEAERERRAKIIHAEGEYQAAERLSQAGHIIAVEPTTLQLRYLQTLTEIATEKTSILIFPVPIDTLSALIKRPGQQGSSDTK